jgi:hypothetical protein
MSEKPLTAADIVAALQSNHYSPAERVLILRAMRDTTPGLVTIDPHMLGRVRAARSVRPETVHTTVNALENSELWQQSSATTPKEIRGHMERVDENRGVIEMLRSYIAMLTDSNKFDYFLAVEKSRAVFIAGRAIGGEAALTIKPQLDLIAETRPARRRKKAEEPATPAEPRQ